MDVIIELTQLRIPNSYYYLDMSIENSQEEI